MALAFDSDAIIYAATPGHRLGEAVWALLDAEGTPRLGSVLLLSELLVKPTREGRETELRSLLACLGRLDLRTIDAQVAALSVTLGAAYRLKAPDAIHLASAVDAGADGFVTNNRKDFDKPITEIEVVFVDEL